MNTADRMVRILNSRSARKIRQASMLRKSGCTCILSFTVNMPGPDKGCRMARDFFNCGLALIEKAFSGFVLSSRTHLNCAAGPEFIAALSGEVGDMKAIAVGIEESQSWTRMLDIDVIPPDGTSLSRPVFRKCLVCASPAKLCARSQAHTYEEVMAAVRALHLQCMARHYADLACQSLLAELDCTPKPGLVDRNNCGSHLDLTYSLMQQSALVLRPWFERMALEPSFDELRECGKMAEKAMLAATGGVNTHKGAIFCFGILVWCASRLGSCTPSSLSRAVRKLCRGLTGELRGLEDLKGLEGTKGSLCFARYGTTGARGQAESGYRIVVDTALPFYQAALSRSDESTALSRTLLLLISKVDDTCIVSRSDMATLHWAQKECSSLLEAQASTTDIEKLDRSFIERNISPGGCADLLAATWFFAHL